MPTQSDKLVFENRRGEKLAARLDLPAGRPLAYALFAHCFTCSKDILAAGRVSRALAELGLAVLRFDFTGLGGSEGEFENTNFSSNVEDLVCAADHLREHHEAPQILVGHSLGGAAVLVAARQVPEVRAVATIAAPSEPAHVRSLIAADVPAIESEGSAPVQIGGRAFRIQKQFLEDLDEHNLGEALGALGKALLVMHSPVDAIVGIHHAQRIYEAARGFKSFVTLADADHLLSKRRDADYAAGVLAAWASRYIDADEPAPSDATVNEGEVLVEELGPPYTQRVVAGGHTLLADEPASVGGADRGPTPYGYLLGALGSCVAMTLRMYANHKGWPLEKVSVRLRHGRIHARDCESCEAEDGKVDRIERTLELSGPLDDAQRARLLEIADRCPVHKTLEGEKEIVTELA